MPQVRKPSVDRRIREAALQRFAADGYEGTSMAAIAATAGMAPGNLYRYYPDGKAHLFETVVTDEVADAHEQLIAQRVRALLLPLVEPTGEQPDAAALLDFWVAHRLEVTVLLGRAEGTRFADHGQRFVDLLVELAVARVRDAGVEPTAAVRHLLTVIFDNTRRALVALLAAHDDAVGLRSAIQGFWSYQLPGLDGFYRWVTAPTSGEPEQAQAASPAPRRARGSRGTVP